MPEAQGMTGKQLLEIYPEKKWRERFTTLVDLLDFLGDCIIDNDYTIPDAMSDAIHLTDEGNKLVDRLVRKEKVPPKEARIMTALTLGHQELFIDVESTDIDALSLSVSKQIVDRKISYPFAHGRELYDVYAELFLTEKETLSLTETFELIERLPIGVFQHGKYVCGPYGLLIARTKRNIPASRSVPAYHCEQASCELVHRVHLSTSQDALINAHRDRVRKILEAEPNMASDWEGLARLATGLEHAFFADARAGSVTPILADCLSDKELRTLFGRLLDGFGGELREDVKPYIGGGNSSRLAEALNRAQLLQLTFLAKEEHIANALDTLVAERAIEVPNGEIRVPRMSGRARVGAYRLRSELGTFGHRFASSDPGFASLRLRRLLDDLYDLEDPTQKDELAWQLRSMESGDITEQLETFFRTTDPQRVIEQLAFARRANVERVARVLELAQFEDLDDDVLVRTILWKLGFVAESNFDPNAKFWSLFTKCSSLTESLRVSGIGDSEEFRGTASVFFSELEGVLQRALSFAAWSLLSDHADAPEPFSYDSFQDFARGIEMVNEAFAARANDAESLHIDPERPELYALSRGFATLSAHLSSLDPKEHRRSVDNFPTFYGKTALKDFAFTHVIPFLDLMPEAQVRIIKELDSISASLIAGETNDVRNHYSHYRRLSPDIDKMSNALDSIRKSVESIELLGFSPAPYSWDGQETDRWGRTQVHMLAPNGRTAVFAMPTRYDWMGLPRLQASQYLVRSAVFAEPNEILRFQPRYSSEYTNYWVSIPNRRRKLSGVEPREGTSTEHTGSTGLIQ